MSAMDPVKSHRTLGLLFAGFSLKRTEIDSCLVRVGFEKDQVATGQVFPEYFQSDLLPLIQKDSIIIH